MKVRTCRPVAIAAFVSCTLANVQTLAQEFAYITDGGSNRVSLSDTLTDAVFARGVALQCWYRLARFVTVFTATALIAAGAAMLPQARAAGTGGDGQPEAAAMAGDSWCAGIPPGFGHPPVNLTPLTLELRQPSVEPVPATDGLIHLSYAAQVTNTQATPADILGIVPVDPLAGFAPTGCNLITDGQGRDVAGKVKLFVQSPDDTMPADSTEVEPGPGFSTHVPGGNSGLMWFDVTYTTRTRSRACSRTRLRWRTPPTKTAPPG